MDQNNNEEPIQEDPQTVADLPPEEILARTPEHERQFWLIVFFSLLKYPRFREFVDNSFEIGKAVDEDTKTVEIRILEKPYTEKGPQLSTAQVFKLHGLLSSFRVNPNMDVVECAKGILNLFGQEQSSIIVPSSDDVNKINNAKLIFDDRDIKSKLD